MGCILVIFWLRGRFPDGEKYSIPADCIANDKHLSVCIETEQYQQLSPSATILCNVSFSVQQANSVVDVNNQWRI
jgi:hypothetical protein